MTQSSIQIIKIFSDIHSLEKYTPHPFFLQKLLTKECAPPKRQQRILERQPIQERGAGNLQPFGEERFLEGSCAPDAEGHSAD